MGIPLYTINTTEGAAFGAAMVRKEDEATPDPEDVAQYEALYPTFRDLYPALKGTFGALSAYES